MIEKYDINRVNRLMQRIKELDNAIKCTDHNSFIDLLFGHDILHLNDPTPELKREILKSLENDRRDAWLELGNIIDENRPGDNKDISKQEDFDV